MLLQMDKLYDLMTTGFKYQVTYCAMHLLRYVRY